MKRFALALLLLLLLATAFLRWRRENTSAVPPASATTTTAAAAPAALPVEPAPPFPLNSPDHDIRTDLQLLDGLFETFRSNFPRTGNPVGDNAEITAALTGRNALRLAFIPREHPAINGRGELCDRWATPFFFHQLSASALEIRSAGPDRQLWTDDDSVLTP